MHKATVSVDDLRLPGNEDMLVPEEFTQAEARPQNTGWMSALYQQHGSAQNFDHKIADDNLASVVRTSNQKRLVCSL